MPEPYLGDIRNAKVAIINLNPGNVIDFQKWEGGSEVQKLYDKSYEEWAKEFIYLDVNRSDVGDFWYQRKKFVDDILDIRISTNNLVNIELFAWHSDKYGCMKDQGTFFEEFVIEPLNDTKVEYILLFRRPTIDAIKKAGVEMKKYDYSWKAGEKACVEVGKIGNIKVIGFVNNMKGIFAQPEDKNKIRNIIANEM